MVLVGVSRTSKTPTSIYLANRGVKTANYPLVPGVPPPPKLETLRQPLVVGLDGEPGAHRADPAEPAARPSRRARRRRLCRPRGGGGGDRGGAQALRQAQLADHRRDAPLDRGNRRRGDGAAGRAPPAARRWAEQTMPLWLAGRPLVLASKSAARRALLEAAGIPVEIEPADIDERGVEARAGARTTQRRPRRCWRARRRRRWRRSIRTGWCSAPTRRWRSAQRRFSKAADRAGAREQLAPCAARRTRCIPPSRWCKAAR